MGNTHTQPCKYTKYAVYLTLKQIHKIHQGGVSCPPPNKYTKYTMYLAFEQIRKIRISHLGLEWRPTHSAVRRGPEARKRSAEEHLLLRDPIDPVSTRIESAETAAAKAPAALGRPVAAGAPTGLLTRASDGGFERRLGWSLLRARGAPL